MPLHKKHAEKSKRSRNTSINSAASQRAFNYSNNISTDIPPAMKQTKGSRQWTGDRANNELYILKVHKASYQDISKVILSKQIDEGLEKWKQIMKDLAVTKYGAVCGEVE